MIRIAGEIQQAKEVENLIKQGTHYLSVPFFVRIRHVGIGGEFKQAEEPSRCFTREYEVFGSPSDIKRVSDNSERWMRDMILWLTRRNINIKFVYDYRFGKCEIVVSCDSWVRLCKLVPQLKGRVKIIEPNRCELVNREAVA